MSKTSEMKRTTLAAWLAAPAGERPVLAVPGGRRAVNRVQAALRSAASKVRREYLAVYDAAMVWACVSSPEGGVCVLAGSECWPSDAREQYAHTLAAIARRETGRVRRLYTTDLFDTYRRTCDVIVDLDGLGDSAGLLGGFGFNLLNECVDCCAGVTEGSEELLKGEWASCDGIGGGDGVVPVESRQKEVDVFAGGVRVRVRIREGKHFDVCVFHNGEIVAQCTDAGQGKVA